MAHRHKNRPRNGDSMTVTPVAKMRDVPESEAAVQSRAKLYRILMVLALLGVGSGVLAYVTNRGGEKKDGKDKVENVEGKDLLSDVWKDIASRKDREKPLSPAEMEDAFMELERLGLGKVFWKEPEGKADPTQPPSLSVALLHGDSNGAHAQKNSADVVRRTALSAKHLRNAGFRTLGIEGLAAGTPMDKKNESLDVNNAPLPWQDLDRKLGTNPLIARQLVNQRVDIDRILGGALPPGTWSGIEPPDILKKMTDELPQKQKLDDSVHRFLGRLNGSRRGDEWQVEMRRNPNGSIHTVVVGGESFDAGRLREELKLWQAMHRNDNLGPDAQERNRAFAEQKNPVYIGTGHILAVQAAAAKNGRKAGFFLPHGAVILKNVDDDVRMLNISAVLEAMDREEAGKR